MIHLACQTIKITSDTKVGTDGVAAIIGMTRQRVVQLTQEGVFSKDSAGKYSLVDSVRRWIAYKSTGASERDLDEERALHEKAKRETAELRLARLRNEIHDAKDVEIMVGSMVTVFKRRMLAIPHKMALMLAGKSPEDVNEILTAEISAALIELSQFDASKLGEYDGDSEEDS